MSLGSRTLRGLALAWLVLLPLGLVQAHGEHGEEDGGSLVHEEMVPPNAGYTGPASVPYLNFFQGVAIYGQIREDRLYEQYPRNVRGDGDWLVWEDAYRGDIFLYSISARDGFYLTHDQPLQRNPDISGGVVVWEDYASGNTARIHAYFIETGETMQVSSGAGNHRKPSVSGHLVAWEDDREGNLDIWAASLVDGSVFPVATSTDRESDPLVMGEHVYFRAYRYNVWDVIGHHVPSNHTFAVTSDAQIQAAPFSNGRDVLFVTQERTAWTLQRYDAAADRVRTTAIRTGDTARTPASGEHLLQLAREAGYAQVLARNLTSGSTNHVTGNLRLVTDPHLDGKTAYLMVLTAQGVSLVVVEVSDFAFSKRPSLVVNTPLPGTPWVRPLTAQGVLRAGTDWLEPETFTYRINGGPPFAVPASQNWQFVLDPADIPPGQYEITLRATYREGPPIEATFLLSVPITSRGFDLEELGPAYHRARLFGAYNKYVGDNAASWIVLPLLLVIVALVVFRLVLAWRARRRELRIEFVRP